MEQINECQELTSFKAKLAELITRLAPDAEKFYTKGNKAAGVRLRKGYKNLQAFIKDFSKETASNEPKK